MILIKPPQLHLKNMTALLLLKLANTIIKEAMKQSIFSNGKLSIAILGLCLPLLLTSCKKDILLSASNGKYVINNERYEDQDPILISPGGTHTPSARYSLTNNTFDFYSECRPKDTSRGLPFYVLRCRLFMDSSLTVGGKYTFTPLPDLDSLILWDEKDRYDEQRKSYCTIHELVNPTNLCFGTGYLEITKIDFEKKWVEGNLSFEMPSPTISVDKESNKERLKFKGEFECFF